MNHKKLLPQMIRVQMLSVTSPQKRDKKYPLGHANPSFALD